VVFGGEAGLSHHGKPGWDLTPILTGGSGEGWLVGVADQYHHQGVLFNWTGTIPSAAPIHNGELAAHARAIGPLCRNLAGFKAAGNRRNALLCAWLDQGLTNERRLFVNRFTASKGWEAAPTEILLPDGWFEGESLSAAVADNGTAFLAWLAESWPAPGSARRSLWVASAKPGQGWSKPEELAHSALQGLGQVAMAPGPGDTVAVAWSTVVQGPHTTSLSASLYRPDTGWSPPKSTPGFPGPAHGRATLVFTGPDQMVLAHLAEEPPDAGTYVVRTAVYGSGIWSPIRTHGRPSKEPQYGLASDGQGHTLLVWRQEGEREDQGVTVFASVASGPDLWELAKALTPGTGAPGAVGHVAAAMGPDGTACALWDTCRDARPSGWASIFKPRWR
jgi:hypothetical protein